MVSGYTNISGQCTCPSASSTGFRAPVQTAGPHHSGAITMSVVLVTYISELITPSHGRQGLHTKLLRCCNWASSSSQVYLSGQAAASRARQKTHRSPCKTVVGWCLRLCRAAAQAVRPAPWRQRHRGCRPPAAQRQLPQLDLCRAAPGAGPVRGAPDPGRDAEARPFPLRRDLRLDAGRSIGRARPARRRDAGSGRVAASQRLRRGAPGSGCAAQHRVL